MKRRKRNAMGRVIRWAILLTLPVTAALGAKGMKSAFEVLGFYDEKSVAVVNGKVSSDKPVEADLLSAEMVLSKGYGVYAQVERGEVRLPSPLDMVSENAGEKPYPTSWTKGVGIVRSTYGKCAFV